MHEQPNDPKNPQNPIEILASLQDESLSNNAVEFAHFLAESLKPSDSNPRYFTMAASLAVFDLQTGIDDFTNEPIDSSLVGLTNDDYVNLCAEIPFLASVAHTPKFGYEVAVGLVEAGLIPMPNIYEPTAEDSTELITEPITDIDTVYEKIIDDTKNRALGLQWDRFEYIEVPKEIVKVGMLLSLRNSPYKNVPINVFVDEPGMEAGLLMEMMPHQIRQDKGEYWIGMMQDNISPEEAMMVKDHLLITSLEAVAEFNELDAADVIYGLSLNVNGPVNRASMRLKSLIEKNPDILK